MPDSPELRRESRYGTPAADQIITNRHYTIGYSYYFRQAKWALEIIEARCICGLSLFPTKQLPNHCTRFSCQQRPSSDTRELNSGSAWKGKKLSEKNPICEESGSGLCSDRWTQHCSQFMLHPIQQANQ